MTSLVSSVGRAAGWSRVSVGRVPWSWDFVIITLLVLGAGAVHAINMSAYPYYENDEGTYVSQAWAVVTQGELAPYTYWYDHSPFGWIQLAGLSLLTGGFHAFGTTVETGRVFMLLYQVGATFLVYRIARVVSGDRLTAITAAAIFGLSAYGIYYHRRILLDNIAVPWVLASILLLLTPRVGLLRVWLSALALGAAVLSKELTVFLVPALAYLVATRVARVQRWFAVTGWVAVAGATVTLYPLMAALKGELFPTGSLLGGTNPHVSLLGSVGFQANRDKDGGLLEAGSQFWVAYTDWLQHDPLLVLVGTACAFLSLLLVRRQPAIAAIGLGTLSLWAFLARGGIVLPFYLVPLLPLLALDVALVSWYAARWVGTWPRIPIGLRRPARLTLQLSIFGLMLALVMAGHLGPAMARGSDPLALWRGSEAVAQQQAVDWVRGNLPPRSSMMLDDSIWTDLVDGPDGTPTFDQAHWYWKVGLDPEISTGVFEDTWRTIDYVIVTWQLENDVRNPGMELPREALERSTHLISFDTGGWPVHINRVNKVQRLAIAEDALLLSLWDQTRRSVGSDGILRGIAPEEEATAVGLALVQAVYAGDRETFDAVWLAARENSMDRDSGLLRSAPAPDGSPEAGSAASAADVSANQYAAFALGLASKAWTSPGYAVDARLLLDGIWAAYSQETYAGAVLSVATEDVGTRAVPVAGIVPFAYPVFASIDPEHDWLALRDGTYALLERVMARPLLADSGLLPEVVPISAKNGRPLTIAPDEASASAAAQLAWQLAVDWIWTNDPRPSELLTELHRPVDDLGADQSLPAAYGLDGSRSDVQAPMGRYAQWLAPALLGPDPQVAHRLLGERILRPMLAGHEAGETFIDRSWGWLSAALLDGGLVNIYRGQTVVEWRGQF